MVSLEQILSPSVPVLQPTDTGVRALRLMDDTHLDQIPMVDDGQYLALIRESEVLEWPKPEEALQDAAFARAFRPAVTLKMHPYEVLKVMHAEDLLLIPVVDGTNQYLGSITRSDLLDYIVETSGIDNPGSILVLEMDPRNYSLSQIARICEGEGISVLSSQIFTNPETQMLEVTLKTNRTALGGVVQAFGRYGIVVAAVYGDDSDHTDLTDRYDNLMAYLNV